MATMKRRKLNALMLPAFAVYLFVCLPFQEMWDVTDEL